MFVLCTEQVQDVLGTFAMIVVTYHIMLMFGPFELEPNDICSPADVE